MSRAQDVIRKQAESQGWTVTFIEWEPIGAGPEKAGPSGGWFVDLERDGADEQALGYNIAQVVQWIKNLDAPPGERADPFACSGKHARPDPGDCILARGHRGDHRVAVPAPGAPEEGR